MPKSPATRPAVPSHTVADYWVWAISTSRPFAIGARAGKIDAEEMYDVAVKLHLAVEYNKPMYYKTDDQTRAGMYAKNGSKKDHHYKYP
ncbi:hypothetical protein KVV02_005535, partial [Mortierella alpina]